MALSSRSRGDASGNREPQKHTNGHDWAVCSGWLCARDREIIHL